MWRRSLWTIASPDAVVAAQSFAEQLSHGGLSKQLLCGSVAIKERPLPKFEAQESPCGPSKSSLGFDGFLGVRIVEKLSISRSLGGEDVEYKFRRGSISCEPAVEGDGEAHLVRSLHDGGRKMGGERPLEQVLEIAVLELDVCGDRRRQLDDGMVEQWHS